MYGIRLILFRLCESDENCFRISDNPNLIKKLWQMRHTLQYIRNDYQQQFTPTTGFGMASGRDLGLHHNISASSKKNEDQFENTVSITRTKHPWCSSINILRRRLLCKTMSLGIYRHMPINCSFPRPSLLFICGIIGKFNTKQYSLVSNLEATALAYVHF